MTTSLQATGLKKHIPILGWLPTYQPSWLRGDLLAGVATAAVVIPQAMAYAALAGLPVEVGLYASLTPMVVYALLGTSRVLSVSVTSTISLLTASVLAATVPTTDPGETLIAAGTLALMVGLLLILAGIFRLGFLANFISAPVLAGFKAGIGVVILVGQIGKALGFSVPKGGFVQTLLATIRGLDEANWASIFITLLVLAILVFLPRFNRRVPAALVAVAAGILSAFILSRMGAFTESIASARAFAEQSDPMVDANQELLALGAANAVGGFFQAYPGGGGTSQTAVNKESGAKSQMAALATALTVALTLLVLAPLVGLIPDPALAALVLAAAAGLVKVGEFRAIGRYRSVELIWALVAFSGVMLLGVLQGILVAIALSVLMLLHAANHPPGYAVGRKPGTEIFRSLEDHPDDETFPGLLIMRTEGRMNFASMPNARDELQRLVVESEPQVVILECSAIPDFEYSALMVLTAAESKMASAGIKLWLVGLNPEPFQRIRASSLGQTLGDERMFPNLPRAVSYYLEQFDESKTVDECPGEKNNRGAYGSG
ncbi:MAG: SulP family inorganic anion transporter [Anaerolineales bacterium]